MPHVLAARARVFPTHRNPCTVCRKEVEMKTLLSALAFVFVVTTSAMASTSSAYIGDMVAGAKSTPKPAKSAENANTPSKHHVKKHTY